VPEPVLAAQNATAVYGCGDVAVHALEDVSAKFEPGEVTLVTGASGSGKSTLLSLLGCIRAPDRGDVVVLGHRLTHCSEAELVSIRRSHVGFVFQFFRLFRYLTALENVELGLEVTGNREGVRESAKEALDAVGLASKLVLKPAQMSGGEQQRVAIARALVKNPEVLLADEPTAALDSSSGSQIVELIRSSVKTKGCVAVIATHDPRLLPIADRVLELRDGKIIQDRRSP